MTICTWKRQPFLTGQGDTIVREEISSLPDRFPGATTDIAIVMPDHLHFIFQLVECGNTLSEIVQAFKSLTTKNFREQCSINRVWQRGFYDRVIRDEGELNALREYIQLNPLVHAVRIAGSA